MFAIAPFRRSLASLAACALCLLLAPRASAQADLVVWGNAGSGLISTAPVGQGLVATAGGIDHFVGLRQDGKLVSWGSDTWGQVSQTPLGSDFVAVSAGNHHSVALRGDGTLVAWGRDSLGQVSGAPGGNLWVEVSASGNNNVALSSSGSLFAWGDDIQCNVTCAPTSGTYKAVAAPHAAIKTDGTIISWGTGFASAPAGGDYKQLSIWNAVRVAVRADGALEAFGNADFFGIFAGLPAGNDFVAVSAGFECALALRQNGDVVAWGKNAAGIISAAPGGGDFTSIPDSFTTTGAVTRNVDCNNNGVIDALDISSGTSFDCNQNGTPDECELANPANDQNNNGVLDECEPDSGLAVPSGLAYVTNPVLIGLPTTPNGPAEAVFTDLPGSPPIPLNVFGGSALVPIPPLTFASAADWTSDLTVRWLNGSGQTESLDWPAAYTWSVPRIFSVAPPAVPYSKNKIIQVAIENNYLTSGVGTATFADGATVAAVAIVKDGLTLISTVSPALSAPGNYPLEFRFEEGGVVEYTRAESGALVHLADGIASMSRIWGDQGGGDTVDFELVGFHPNSPVTVAFGDFEAVGVPTGYSGFSKMTVDSPPSFDWGTVDVRLTQDQAQLGIMQTTSPSAWYYDPPEVFAVSPASGWQTGGLNATVFSEGFAEGDATVWFGGMSTPAVVSKSTGLEQVTFVTPPGLTEGFVDVRVQQGVYDVTLPAAFEYTGPSATQLSPGLGLWYLSHTLTATVEGFNPALPVTARVGDSAPVVGSFINPTTVRFVLPADAVGTAGKQILFVEQGAAQAVLKAAWTALPDLASQVTGSAAAGGAVALRVRSGELGTCYVMASPQTVPDPVPIAGIHYGLLLDASVGQVFGKAQLGAAVPTVSYPFGPGVLQPGATFHVQVLTLEAAHALGTLLSFTNMVSITIP